MSLFNHHNHHTHNFLRNKEMNEMYLFYAISNFAYGLMSVFVPIYLYKAGFSVLSIMLFYLIVPASFVVFSLLGAKVVARVGAKHAMIIATPMTIAFLLCLRYVGDHRWIFYVLPIIFGVKSIIFNFGFHLNFMEHSDSRDRGKEVSMIQASAVAAGLLSPLFGGLIIRYYGFDPLFLVGSAIYIISIFPLLATKDIHEKIAFDTKGIISGLLSRENLPMSSSFFGYGVEDWIGYVIWPLFLYIFFLNAEKIGLVTSLTAILTFLTYYYIGRATDKKDKRELIKVGTLLYFIGWAARLFVSSFFSALFVDTYKNISGNILQVPWSAYSYDLAARSDYFKFIVQRELIFDLSRIVVVPFVMLVFVLDFHPFLTSFIVAAVSSLLYVFINKMDVAKLELQYEKK